MWNPFRRSPPPAPKVELVAQPLVVGSGQDPVAYARYRLDAIKRHMELHPDLPDDRRAEFRVETFSLVHALHQAKAMTPEDEAAAMKRVGIGGQF